MKGKSGRKNVAAIDAGAVFDEDVSDGGWFCDEGCDIMEWKWRKFCCLETCGFCEGFAS